MENHQLSNAKALDLEWLMFDKRSPNLEPRSELLSRYPSSLDAPGSTTGAWVKDDGGPGISSGEVDSPSLTAIEFH